MTEIIEFNSTTTPFVAISPYVCFLIQKIMNQPQLAAEHFDIFFDGGSYIECLRMYFAYFKTIPTLKTIYDLNIDKVRDWLTNEYGSEIVTQHARQTYDWEEKRIYDVDAFYLFGNNLLLNLEKNASEFFTILCRKK